MRIISMAFNIGSLTMDKSNDLIVVLLSVLVGFMMYVALALI